MTKHAGPRSERIGDHVRSVGARSMLDVLFISHVHADHLNGLPQRLHAKTGVEVDTIVLPYFDVVERLVGYARDATQDPATTIDVFYRDCVTSPAAALPGFYFHDVFGQPLPPARGPGGRRRKVRPQTYVGR